MCSDVMVLKGETSCWISSVLLADVADQVVIQNLIPMCSKILVPRGNSLLSYEESSSHRFRSHYMIRVSAINDCELRFTKVRIQIAGLDSRCLRHKWGFDL